MCFLVFSCSLWSSSIFSRFVLHLKYFLFFFCIHHNILRKLILCKMILSAVGTSNFLQTILLQVVLVLFIAFRTCLSSFTGFSVVSIFLAFEALQGRWDVLLDTLKKIDIHLFGSTGLIKCQDVSVDLDSFFTFSNEDSSYICNSLFSQRRCFLLFCSQCQPLTPDNTLGSVEVLMRVGPAFRRMKGFYF